MGEQTNLTDVLLDQINRGESDSALQHITVLLEQQPNHPGLLTLKAEALRLSARPVEAIEAYRRAGAVGGGARNWFLAGLLSGEHGRPHDVLTFLTYAVAEDPTDEKALEALLSALLDQINRREVVPALEQIDNLLGRYPTHLGLLTLRAEALRFAGRINEAIKAYREVAAAAGGSRNWLVAGLMLSGERRIDEALECLTHAIADEPGNEEVLHALVTTSFNANRSAEGIPFALRLLAISRNSRFLSDAALLLQTGGRYDEAAAVFKKILAIGEDHPAQLGAALVPSRYTCEWDWIESLQARMSAYYARGQYGAPEEYPLTHVTWCINEAYNLEVTRAFAASRMAADLRPLSVQARKSDTGGRIRVGYLSCDFCNHATMHLMAGLLENHDRDRFEVFAYDYSSPADSEYRRRFLDAIEHHVDITGLTDAEAAVRIAQDQLDIVFDLKGHTGWARPAILAYRPAPLQVAYLGYPGSTATSYIDYLVGDRFVTPDSSAPFYVEKFCRLPNSYQCNDRKRRRADDPGTRASHGLPADEVVFCTFNQAYKIDRNSFSVWMRVLNEVPGSVLWLLGQGEAAERNLRRTAEAVGVHPDRLIFAGFAPPEQHIARLRLADAALDALICNGHTTTSDTLWAGVPVVTARGSHFASRVSESLLNAMDLSELVGSSDDEMVKIAARIGLDAAYRKALREKILTAPLFDTERFTRNFESAICMMVEACKNGEPLPHLDVADCDADQATSCNAGNHSEVMAVF
jgi:protein O-GlcNAc transferase